MYSLWMVLMERNLIIRKIEKEISNILYFELNDIQISKTNKNTNIYFGFDLINFQKQIDKKFGI